MVRAVWGGDEEEDQVRARDQISLARAYMQNRLAEVPGVHLVISCLTGVETNAKQSGGTRDPLSSVRVAISLVCFYSPSNHCDDTTIFDICAQAGMSPKVRLVSTLYMSDKYPSISILRKPTPPHLEAPTRITFLFVHDVLLEAFHARLGLSSEYIFFLT